MWHITIFDAVLCNLPGKQKNEAEKAAEKFTTLVPLGSPESCKNKWRGQDKHTREMHSKLSRRLIESTLIKMLTETFWIYERGLVLREKKQHSARAEVTICQVLSRCTVPHTHTACTYVHGLPHMSPRLLNFLCFYFASVILHVVIVVVWYCFTTKFNWAIFCKKKRRKKKRWQLQDQHFIIKKKVSTKQNIIKDVLLHWQEPGNWLSFS